MTRTQLLALTTALTTTLAAQAVAQTRMSVQPASKLTVAGGSNVHAWACQGATFLTAIEMDSSYLTRPMTELAKPIAKVSVIIPVKSLKCGNGKMDENMYKALNANQFPEIKYVLESYEIDAALSTVDGFAAKTVGNLTVAGKTVRVEIPLSAMRKAGGSISGEGSLKLKMTDFGIKPPVALLGTLRTKDEISIAFQVLLDKAVVVALQQQP
jgi:polyisoprenoid-binding protein YceI